MLRQEEIEYAKTRAIVQALIGKDEAVKSFDAYRELALPFVDAANKSVADESKKVLMREVRRGALVATPLWNAMAKGKSKIKQRHQEAAQSRDQVKKMNQIYNKMGRPLAPVPEKRRGQ